MRWKLPWHYSLALEVPSHHFIVVISIPDLRIGNIVYSTSQWERDKICLLRQILRRTCEIEDNILSILEKHNSFPQERCLAILN
jgi:hypothetical protein